MRVTFNAIRDGLAAINTASAEMAKAQQQVASGRRLGVPSDDPLAAQQAIADHAVMGTVDAYARTADAAASRLSSADSVLGDMIDKLTLALGTATGVRGNISDQASREAASQTLLGIRDSLLGDVNTTYDGTSLFAGSKVTGPAYANTASGWVYQGDNTPVQVEVEHGRLVTVGFDGHSIFQGSDGTDVLTVLDGLAAAVRNGDAAAISSAVDSVQHAFNRIVRTQSSLGVDESGITDAKARLSSRRLAAETDRSKAEDANPAEAITRMSQAQIAYQAALGAVSAVEKKSLLDYLP